MDSEIKLDKNKELSVELRLLNDRLNFLGSVEGQTPVSIDYIPPLGDNLGYTSLELFLLSLASCFGSSLAVLLRRKGKTITSMELKAKGKRRETHPTCFESIVIYLDLVSPDATADEVDTLITIVEDKFCPVYAMIKGNVEVDYEVNIRAD